MWEREGESNHELHESARIPRKACPAVAWLGKGPCGPLRKRASCRSHLCPPGCAGRAFRPGMARMALLAAGRRVEGLALSKAQKRGSRMGDGCD